MAIVRYKASDIPSMTKEDAERIGAIRDEDIDFSDIPPLSDEFWKMPNGLATFTARRKSRLPSVLMRTCWTG